MGILTSLGRVYVVVMKCCGVDGYKDFENGNSWDLKETTNPANKVRVLKMPVSCCKSLPQSDDLSCAQTVSDTLNYHDTLLLIVSGIAILVMNDDAKAQTKQCAS
ncbi:hypothetical protein MAR_021879 [Mya arenaria]|uniref:Uncharacterized protein n=1 Tax=Mya arenaria TaxID=6604 RepID=A0ABY7E9I4_MYAAR|nr:hypothetical protein MAR_021879 [Mya arenaria]